MEETCGRETLKIFLSGRCDRGSAPAFAVDDNRPFAHDMPCRSTMAARRWWRCQPTMCTRMDATQVFFGARKWNPCERTTMQASLTTILVPVFHAG